MPSKLIHLCYLFAIMLSLFPYASEARPLIADSHPRKINIDHNFKGVDILLYGARNEYGNVVVVVRGPKKDFVLREKGRVAGIWTNTKNIKLDDFYSFYSVASTRPLSRIENDNLLKHLGVGAENLDLITFKKVDSAERSSAYKNAAIVLMENAGLYSHQDNELFFWGETLFRTFVEFPKNIVKGEYSIDLYLFNDGLLHSFQTMPIIVEKVGFEAFIHDLAKQNSLLYGIICVLIAITLGWGTGFIFGKR